MILNMTIVLSSALILFGLMCVANAIHELASAVKPNSPV